MPADHIIAAPTERKKLARAKERSGAAPGYASQNMSSVEGAKEGVISIGDVTETHVEQTGPQGRNFTYIDIGSIDRTTKRIVYPKVLPSSKAPSRAKQLLKAGDVLVSMTRPNLNAVALVPPDLDGAIGSTGFHVLRACDAEPGFLFYAVQSNEFIDAMCRKVQGALYPAVRPRDISSFRVPAFSLAAQRAAVAEIEKQFTRLEAGVAALRRVQANLRRYRAAILKAACDGRFPQEPISTVIGSLDQGWSPKCDREPASTVGEWAVIKTSAIQCSRFVEGENKRLPNTLTPRPHLELRPGDLLITRAGPRSRAGVTCLVRNTRPRLILCDKAYRLRTKAKLADPRFLEIVLNAPHIVDAIDELKTGISDSGVNLTQRRFGDLIIPVPSINEQERIIADVERRLTTSTKVDFHVTALEQRAFRLRQSLIRSAICGEL